MAITTTREQRGERPQMVRAFLAVGVAVSTLGLLAVTSAIAQVKAPNKQQFKSGPRAAAATPSHTDTPADPHSPRQHGFWWSHSGWFLTPRGFRTDWEAIPDLRRFPELRFLDRFDLLLPALLALALFLLGGWLQRQHPQLGTDGPQLLVWGFFVSTVALFHATFTINSLAHRFGSRRFDTRDDSRNNAWLALLTFGEGWHNNHHFFPGAARQGFRWWEIDLSWYGLRVLAALGLVHGLKPVPAWVLARARG
jgi:stearoyl-CoA desaturase (delta-9 desaturase)